MKKLIAFIGLFAMVLVALPCNVASAEVTVPQEVIDKAIECNYGIDNIVILQDASGDYYFPVELDANKNYGTPYDTEVYQNGAWYIGGYDGVNYLVSPSWWHLRMYCYVAKTGICFVNSNQHGHVISLDGSLTVVYSTKNIYYGSDTGELEGQLFFGEAPVPMTELARILEESNRLTTPTIQVIYLLPLVISLVVSFLALRKCLQVLRTILSGA